MQLPTGNVAHCEPGVTGGWPGQLCLDKAMAVVLLSRFIPGMCCTQIPTVSSHLSHLRALFLFNFLFNFFGGGSGLWI
jgi:hypothetical protein